MQAILRSVKTNKNPHELLTKVEAVVAEPGGGSGRRGAVVFVRSSARVSSKLLAAVTIERLPACKYPEIGELKATGNDKLAHRATWSTTANSISCDT